MLGLCRCGGCCIAPLLFGRGKEGDDKWLSHEDHLESAHFGKAEESRLVEEEVSVRGKHQQPDKPSPRLWECVCLCVFFCSLSDGFFAFSLLLV